MKMKIKVNSNFQKNEKECTINLKECLIILNDLVKFKDILKSIDLDLINKKSIALNFQKNDLKISYKFYNLTNNTYNKIDNQIIKLFFN